MILTTINTSSVMQEEINGVINAIKKFITKIDANLIMALVNVKNDVTKKATSTDHTVLKQLFENLEVSSNSLCPEETAEALEIAIQYLEDNGVILLATDTSSY